MEAIDSEKELLKDNLIEAVKNCPHLKVNSRKYDLFNIIPISFLDFTDKKCEDGCHLYTMDSIIEITNNLGDNLQNRGNIHFYAIVKGVSVEIENGLIIADYI